MSIFHNQEIFTYLSIDAIIFYIDDDAFITNYVSTISGVSQMTSRFLYGSLLDYIPFRILLGFQSLLLGVAVALLYTVASMGKAAFALWMHLIYLTFPGIYAILPGTLKI